MTGAIVDTVHYKMIVPKDFKNFDPNTPIMFECREKPCFDEGVRVPSVELDKHADKEHLAKVLQVD